MADDVEKVLEEEYKRLTRRGSPNRSTSLLDLLLPAPQSGAVPSPADGAAATSQPIASASTEAARAASFDQGNTLPASTSGPAQTSGGSTTVGKIGETAFKLFTSGLGVLPMISGIAGLFGGGDPPAPPPLLKYAMPKSIQLTAANSRNGEALSAADYNQDGAVRRLVQNSAPVVPASTGNAASAQVVVNVQAMDSRSFLDHSQEIAQAVREAMLNMHALNDVVSEL